MHTKEKEPYHGGERRRYSSRSRENVRDRSGGRENVRDRSGGRENVRDRSGGREHYRRSHDDNYNKRYEGGNIDRNRNYSKDRKYYNNGPPHNDHHNYPRDRFYNRSPKRNFSKERNNDKHRYDRGHNHEWNNNHHGGNYYNNSYRGRNDRMDTKRYSMDRDRGRPHYDNHHNNMNNGMMRRERSKEMRSHAYKKGDPCKIFVGNISPDAREEEVRRKFAKYGDIISIQWKRRFAFIEYSKPIYAENAIHEENGKHYMGEELSVQAHHLSPFKNSYSGNYGNSYNNYKSDPRNYENKYSRNYSDNKFESIEKKNSLRIVVKNIDEKVSWQDLKDFGREVGSVNYANVIYNNNGNNKEWYGIIEYYNYETMKRAVEVLNGKKFNGVPVEVIKYTDSSVSSFYKNKERENDHHYYNNKDKGHNYHGPGGDKKYYDYDRDKMHRDDRREYNRRSNSGSYHRENGEGNYTRKRPNNRSEDMDRDRREKEYNEGDEGKDDHRRSLAEGRDNNFSDREDTKKIRKTASNRYGRNNKTENQNSSKKTKDEEYSVEREGSARYEENGYSGNDKDQDSRNQSIEQSPSSNSKRKPYKRNTTRRNNKTSEEYSPKDDRDVIYDDNTNPDK
ncbi:RNA-binding protein, putative [Plasmodium chabaudi adami]|uniref:RNA-binding protein, putative n=1 Tax=Plasmodium chabaudi adami TaxID=5826 RepID=A0A1D3RZP2_PLACE|nr:RNA-binding protein, putative [Plasmodium chabaudi adami]